LPALRRGLRKLGLMEVVRNLGDMDRGRMQSIYDELDVFVFPSLCESFGFPLVEAMARGLPVIGADVPSTREIGGTALDYFPPDDDHALAQAIAAVMGDADRYALQSRRALERSRHYSWACSAEMNLVHDRSNVRQEHTVGHGGALREPSLRIYDRRRRRADRVAAAVTVPSIRGAPPPCWRHGCGCGLRTQAGPTLYLLAKGCAVTAVDLTRQALVLTRNRAPAARLVQASNLDLPFAAESFDAVVSDGVIHHTPDPYRALVENVRVLRKGGHLYLGVYKRNRYYYYLYTYVGRPVRWLEHRPWGRLLVNGTLLPVYYLAHLVKSRGKRTWRGAKNLLLRLHHHAACNVSHARRKWKSGVVATASSSSSTIRTSAMCMRSSSASADMKVCIVSSCGGHLTRGPPVTARVRALRPFLRPERPSGTPG
jgi:SAM-dependent methyltransferase